MPMINTKPNFNATANMPPVPSSEELRINAWASSENAVAKEREK
jgi:hypothetical protein